MDDVTRQLAFAVDFNLPPLVLAPGETFDLEVVGESRCQDALVDIAEGKDEVSSEISEAAQLVPIDHNLNDPAAIMVLMQGRQVGWIPRGLCRPLRSELATLSVGRQPIFCMGLICGGWLDPKTGDEGMFGVKLNVSRPLRPLQG